MRRSVQPSFPSAITCCFFSSFKTLLMPTEGTCFRRIQCLERRLSLAGFQVTIIGGFWVTAEGRKTDFFVCQKRRRIVICFTIIPRAALSFETEVTFNMRSQKCFAGMRHRWRGQDNQGLNFIGYCNVFEKKGTTCVSMRSARREV
jgi:hypothetical protein